MKKRVIARLFIKPESIMVFKKLSAQMVEKTNKEEGCIFYSLFEDVARPGEFLFYEEYKDQAALEIHQKSEYLANFRKVNADMHAKKPIIDVV
jgi:quinol monooxygenase YgiN